MFKQIFPMLKPAKISDDLFLVIYY